MELLRLDSVGVLADGATVLRDLSWRVCAGEHWVVLGSNGAGKSTLLRLVAERASCDTVGLLGEVALPAEITAEQAVLTGLQAAYRLPAAAAAVPEPPEAARAAAMLGRLGCRGLAHRQVRTLSEGERRRVLLARALMADPELLLLDEPTAGLDLAGREALLHWLGRVTADPSGPATVTVTHHVEDMPATVTHALLLRAGAVVAAGPVAEVLTGGLVSRCFGLPVVVEASQGRFTARIAPATG